MKNKIPKLIPGKNQVTLDQIKKIIKKCPKDIKHIKPDIQIVIPDVITQEWGYY